MSSNKVQASYDHSMVEASHGGRRRESFLNFCNKGTLEIMAQMDW
jgi:hypothetical protein